MGTLAIIIISSVCGFSGGWLIRKGWHNNTPMNFILGCLLVAIGMSSGVWITLLLR
jgi:hypothetical protein